MLAPLKSKIDPCVAVPMLLVSLPLFLGERSERLLHPAPWVILISLWRILVQHPLGTPRELFWNPADGGSLFGLIASAVVTLGATLFEYAHRSEPPPSPLSGRCLMGLLLVVFAVVLRAWTIRALGKYYTCQLQVQKNGDAIAFNEASDSPKEEKKRKWELVETGVYRWVRHPAYSAILAIYVGDMLMTGSTLCPLLFLTLVLPAFLYRIRLEEAFLCAVLPDAYPGYMRRTWRLFPFVF